MTDSQSTTSEPTSQVISETTSETTSQVTLRSLIRTSDIPEINTYIEETIKTLKEEPSESFKNVAKMSEAECITVMKCDQLYKVKKLMTPQFWHLYIRLSKGRSMFTFSKKDSKPGNTTYFNVRLNPLVCAGESLCEGGYFNLYGEVITNAINKFESKPKGNEVPSVSYNLRVMRKFQSTEDQKYAYDILRIICINLTISMREAQHNKIISFAKQSPMFSGYQTLYGSNAGDKAGESLPDPNILPNFIFGRADVVTQKGSFNPNTEITDGLKFNMNYVTQKKTPMRVYPKTMEDLSALFTAGSTVKFEIQWSNISNGSMGVSLKPAYKKVSVKTNHQSGSTDFEEDMDEDELAQMQQALSLGVNVTEKADKTQATINSLFGIVPMQLGKSKIPTQEETEFDASELTGDE